MTYSPEPTRHARRTNVRFSGHWRTIRSHASSNVPPLTTPNVHSLCSINGRITGLSSLIRPLAWRIAVANRSRNPMPNSRARARDGKSFWKIPCCARSSVTMSFSRQLTHELISETTHN